MALGKLIVRHGERRTEHVLDESPLVIGRDPECQLFFADRKLSRRHASIERDANGFRIVDLGSRNGSWVNEERVDRRRLVSGDQIRLGDVLMSFVHEDETVSAGDEPTVYLGGPSSDDTATVVLDVGGPQAESKLPREEFHLDDSSTRILEMNEEAATDDSSTHLLPEEYTRLSGVSDDSSTRVLPRHHADEHEAGTADESSTQLLPRERTDAHGGIVADDSSTRVLPVDAFEESEETLQKPEGGSVGERTVLRPGEPAVERADSGTVLYRDEENYAPGRAKSGDGEGASLESFSGVFWAARSRGGGSWTLRFAITASLLVLFTVVVLVVPLYSTTRRALEEESRSRGRTLMELLAAVNEAPLGEGRLQDASIVTVERAPGVSGAFVLDATGKIIAPSSQAGEVFAVDGLDVPPQSVRSIRSGRTPAGESVVAGPINYRGRRVGVAVVIQRSAEGATVFALALGLALVLMALAATVVVTRRMTLTPVEELRCDIESLVRGEGRYVDEARSFEEISHLARAVNRLVSSASRRAANREREQH